MGTSTDERGRIYLPKDVRDQYGEEYRVVRMPTHVALIPLDEDPLEGVRDAVGDALEGTDVDELREEALETAKADAEAEMGEREAPRNGGE